MIKRFSAALILTVALVVGTGIGAADARPGPGTALCRSGAFAIHRAELQAGVHPFTARQHLRNALFRCRIDFRAR